MLACSQRSKCGVTVKMQAYQAITDWLESHQERVILAFDGNHWNRTSNLMLQPYDNTLDPFYAENRFYASNAPHDLRDALIEFYLADACAYQKLIDSQSPDP